MQNGKETATATKTKTLVINRTFNLPLSTVWRAWTEPESFKKWWGPTGFTCPDCHIDFRVGGKFHASMQDKEGRKTWSIGTYREIVPQKKFVCTDNFADEDGNVISAKAAGMPGEWPENVLLTVELKENNGKTEMTLTHDNIPENMFDDCRTGWNESLDKLEKIQP